MMDTSIRFGTECRPVLFSSLIGGAFLVLFLGLFLGGCSYFQPVAEPSGPSPLEIGLARLANGDYDGAELTFRDLASRCESGSDGRRSLLFLSFLALDPRNPSAHPDSAVLMAARFLNLPRNTLEETLEAEALYITALDYGADPELRIDPANPGFAVRFGGCDEPFPPRAVRPLPTLESSISGRLSLLDEERDSLTGQNQRLQYLVRQLRLSSDSLQAQLDTLQAELGRIRQLIQLPDTSALRRPPDTGLVRRRDTGLVRLPDTDMTRPPDTDRVRPADKGLVRTPNTGLVGPADTGLVRMPNTGLVGPADTGLVRMPLHP